ncbi:MAG TPA: pyrroloquinoline quinone-dependent dehydrogenase [Blastocatellia bacterium]|nr:pyrroloquinoline quinone-dependent dehydrogenase [Blastocatellia bacterium]
MKAAFTVSSTLSFFLTSTVAAQTDWPNVGNDKGSMRYSTLKQIDRDNVKKLKVAWTYNTGDAGPDNKTMIECTPIVIDGVMYITTAKVKVVALDAATGRELWKYDPFAGVPESKIYPAGNGVNRGVAWWEDATQPSGGSKPKASRILIATADGRLISLDARTGKPDLAFGDHGTVDLRAGMEGDLSKQTYGATAAPAVFEDIVIVPISLSDGVLTEAPGDVRAFDIRTGKQVWAFHTVPRPGEFGHETWQGDGWKNRGGTNPWSGFTIDTKRGLVFMGTGSPAFDFYGGDRLGDNLFGNSVVALDARTGRRVWHFQIIRHDLWDYDLPAPPVLVTVKHNGRKIDAAAQVTKTGYVFLFDRVTGKPLFDVVERAVPASDVPGEATAPKQVFPVKPPALVPQGFTPDRITNLSKEAHDYVAERLKTLQHGPTFTPQSVRGTVILPGLFGGSSWAGASFDPETGTLYTNTNNIPRVMSLIPAEPGKGYPYRISGYDRFNDQEGYPAVKPPWGMLSAVDLNRGEIRWQVTLGELPELTARGIPPTGTENLGGTIVTAGGLVFVAATKDEKFRAFDKTSGKILWEYKLPAAGYATPCTYSVKGRQFVVIAAGGGGKLLTKSGDAFMAFALPEQVAAGR